MKHRRQGMAGIVLASVFLFSPACSETQDPPPSGEPFTPGGVAAQPVQTSTAGLSYDVPSGWTEESATSSMRLAQFRLPKADGDSEDGELVIFYFGGGGGSTQANVDRWIGQFEKADGSSAREVATIEERDNGQARLTTVDINGTYNRSVGPMMMGRTESKTGFRMLAAVVEANGGPWFVKFTGPARTVGQWEQGFNTFLDSFRAQ